MQVNEFRISSEVKKMTKIILDLLIIILSTVGAIELFIEFMEEYEDMRIRFIN